jgi:Zn-dependent protease with chaperone function
MIVASTVVALPLLVIALVARRFRSDLEEAAWRLMAVAMLITPLTLLLPKVDVGFDIPLLTASSTQPELPTDTAPLLLATVYSAVAFVLFARLAFGVAAAWRLRRNAEPFGSAYVSASVRVPVTAGLVVTAILLPADAPAWSAEKLAAVLAHERAHVSRRDPLWRLIGRAATALCWFHPLAWLAAASMERIAEETADREAIAAMGDRHQYADVLLDLLRSMTGTRRRVLLVAGMLDGRTLGTRRSRLATRILLATLVAGAIFTAGMTRYDAPPPTPAETAAQMQQQRAKDLEFFHTRDELRRRFRETIRDTMRNTMRNFFRGLFTD